MMTTEITIQLSPDLADRYQGASSEVQQKAQFLLDILLNELASPPRPISVVMDEISENAQKRGLTPDILEALLEDE